jgi:hypothetical protein
MPCIKWLKCGFRVDIGALVPKLNSHFLALYRQYFQAEISVLAHFRRKLLLLESVSFLNILRYVSFLLSRCIHITNLRTGQLAIITVALSCQFRVLVDYWLNPIGVCNKVVAGAIEDHTLAVIS